MQSLFVLIIGRDELITAVLEQEFVRAGHRPTRTDDARMAIAHLRQTRVDVVLTDLPLQDKNTVRIIQIGRLLQPRVRIVALGGQSDPQPAYSLSVAISLGAVEHVVPPITWEGILHVIESGATAPRDSDAVS